MVWGIPTSILASFLISKVVDITDFALPLRSLVTAVGCILVTVFITMLYGVAKLKKQSPMEVIHSEN